MDIISRLAKSQLSEYFAVLLGTVCFLVGGTAALVLERMWPFMLGLGLDAVCFCVFASWKQAKRL